MKLFNLMDVADDSISMMLNGSRKMELKLVSTLKLISGRMIIRFVLNVLSWLENLKEDVSSISSRRMNLLHSPPSSLARSKP